MANVGPRGLLIATSSICLKSFPSGVLKGDSFVHSCSEVFNISSGIFNSNLFGVFWLCAVLGVYTILFVFISKYNGVVNCF